MYVCNMHVWCVTQSPLYLWLVFTLELSLCAKCFYDNEILSSNLIVQ